MSWISGFFRSSIGKKTIMSLTGLFLCLFLAVHMSGNFLLFQNDGGQAFNEYTKFMTSFPLIKLASIFTYLIILFHIVDGILITIANKKARPVKYAVSTKDGKSSWASKNMALLGMFILLFLVVHLKSFWFEMHWGTVGLDQWGNKDLYNVVVKAFSQWWYTLFYVISLILLGYHLWHGFQSAFQSLGINHKKYTPIIQTFGKLYSVLIPFGFALQPLYVLFTNM